MGACICYTGLVGRCRGGEDMNVVFVNIRLSWKKILRGREVGCFCRCERCCWDDREEEGRWGREM